MSLSKFSPEAIEAMDNTLASLEDTLYKIQLAMAVLEKEQKCLDRVYADFLNGRYQKTRGGVFEKYTKQ